VEGIDAGDGGHRQPGHSSDGSNKTPRNYQVNAINRVIAAVAKSVAATY
jgi:hypothetical protein